MTVPQKDRFRKLCADRGFVYAVASGSTGLELVNFGGASLLRWQGLVKTLFGSPEAVARTLGALEVNEARVLAQGSVRCTYMRPTVDVVVGCFSQDSRGAAELKDAGLLVCGELAALFQGELGEA